MAVPRMSYGSPAGWTHYVDLGEMDTHWTAVAFDEFLGRLWSLVKDCRYVYLTTVMPKTFPGYFTATKVAPDFTWNDPAAGTTPKNAHRWDDPYSSPFYQTPTCYVKARADTPWNVANYVVHEMFHLLMPPGYDSHNDRVGTVFLAPPPVNCTVTSYAAELLGGALWSLRAGHRWMFGEKVSIPHLLSPDAPDRPGPYPNNGPRTSGPVIRLRDGVPLETAALKFKGG